MRYAYVYIFFALLLFLIYQNKTKKLDLLHVLHPTASVSAYLAVMRRKAQGFFHYHAIQRHVTAAISNPKLFCAWMYAQAMGYIFVLRATRLNF